MKLTLTLYLNLVVWHFLLLCTFNVQAAGVAKDMPPSVTASITHVTCIGGSDGAIDITVSGGTSPYTYLWSNGQTTEDISGLAAGNYSVLVTDDLGDTRFEVFTVDPGLDLNSGTNDNIKNVTCYRGKDASIKITVSAGIGPYTYSWTDDNGDPIGDDKSLLQDVPAGNYTVLVTDGNGCTLSKTFTVTEPPAVFTVTPTIDNVSCNGGSDGSISLAVTTSGSGNGKFSYVWTHGPNSASVSGLTAGTYEVQISDNKDCEVHTFTVTEPDPLALSTTQVDIICFGDSSGSIDLTVSGGTAPYSYTWDSGQTTEDLTGVLSGTYDVTVTDANLCTESTSVTLNQSPEMILTTTQVDILCTGDATGSIDLTVSGGAGPYSYSWDSGETTEDISGLAAGTYEVTVTDINLCTKSVSVSIAEPNDLVLSTSQVDVLCFGDASGSINLTVSGGLAPYSYSWDNGQITEDISGLTYGTYKVTVTDTNGCIDSTSVAITEPAELILSTTQVDILCNGDASGSIDLTVAGGATPYSYSWDNGETTEDLTGLIEDTYVVTVTDANGCIETTSITIIEPVAPLVLSTTQVDVDCNGNTNGSIDLTVTGGTTPYSYSWDSGPTTEDISGLAAATYEVTVTDANGCIEITSVDITEPMALTLSTSQVDVLCFGDATGSIDLTVSGGTAPYTYSWGTGETTEDRSGLKEGSYTVIVTDANGCTETTSVTITEPTDLLLSTTQVDIICNGDATGSIDLTVSGGEAPYTYSWDTGETTEDRTGLVQGIYMVTVTDTNGCIETTSVTITEPNDLVLSTTQVNLACKGDTNGSIDLTVAGGVAPYSYSWDSGETTEDLSGLVAGTYNVTVTDASGCVETTSVTITEPATAMSPSTSISDVTCNGANDGAIDLTVVGGTAPYSYAWSNGAVTEDASGLAPGTYSVTITDALGCITVPNLVVNEPPALVLSTTYIDADCFGAATGSIDLTVAGGTAPYSYSWDNGDITEDITGLTEGTYIVTVTDANGCSENASVYIDEPDPLLLSFTQVDVLCNGDATGSIDLTVTDGTAPYTFLWDNGKTTEDLSGLSPGSYTVTVTDANGCTENTTVNIIEPAAITLTENVTDAGCAGGATGAIDLTVAGGTGPFTYSWSNGAATEDISALTFGNYTITVTDANGCMAGKTISVNEDNTFSLSATKVDLDCNGDSNGSIDLTVAGGTAPFDYIWDNGETTEDISGLAAGTYNISVEDALGCNSTLSITIIEPPAIDLSTSQVDILCKGDATGSIDLTVAGGTSPYTYLWDSGDMTEDLTGIAAATYNVTVTDANGCTETASVIITEPVASLALSTSQVNVDCFGNATGSIDLSVSGGTTPYSYLWDNGGMTEDMNSLLAGAYDVTVTDANGCTESTSVTITQPVAPLALTTTQVDVDCFGNATGSIDLTVSGGSAPYSYDWDNMEITEDITGLSKGIYSVIVTDANGCTENTSVTIIEPPVLSLSTTQVDILCYDDASGSIDLTVSGGTAPYSYTWDNGDLTEDLNGIKAGTYNVTVTDANGCTETTNVDITQPTELLLSSTHVNVLCKGDTSGSIDLSVSGGIAPYSYAWDNGDMTEDISSLAAGTYNITVTDANGCTETTAVMITEPAATLALTTTQVNVDCNGNATGSIDLTVSGGTAPYSYLWDNAEITEDLTGLAQGTYNVTVTDASGCTETTSVTITEPATLVLSTSKVDILCSDDASGSINLTVSGGTAPYSYSWNNGDITEDISSLIAGNYSVTVTDANGCTENTSVTITQPAALSLSTTQIDIVCHSDATGSIDLTVSGGTSPYTYNWDNSEITEDLSGIMAGTYNVTVTDASGCTETTSVTITQPNDLVLTTTQVNLACKGETNGSIDLTVSGGVAPYTYSWDNGETTEDLIGLMADTYNVIVTDASGCTETTSVIITEPATAMSPSTTISNVTCNGTNDGAIDLTVVGGTAPYSYAWSNGAFTEDVSGLAPGTYSVTITDALGCITVPNLVITEPALLALSTTQNNVDCNSTGGIDLTVTGGTAPYSYSWDNGDNIEDLSNLVAGTYTVTVTDANGCTENASVTITQPDPLVLATSKSDVSCNAGTDATIDLTVTGGTAPYNYAWSNGSNSEDLSSLAAGNYTVTVTDANGCSETTTVTINEPGSDINATYTVVDVSCFGGSDGAVDLIVSGGTAPYSYLWDFGATSQDVTLLPAGTYSVTITDANGCKTVSGIVINEPVSPIAINSNVTDMSCNGNSDGSIDITVSGGTGPYTYSWSNGAMTEDLSSLSAGSYTITVTDANGCSENSNITVTEPAILSLSETHSDASCFGTADGSIDLTVTGGTAPYTYNWTNGASLEDTSGLSAGAYTVVVTDTNGCTDNITVVISQPTAIVITETVTDAGCGGGIAGSIDLTVSGGTGPYTYSWSTGAITDDISGLSSGNYTITVTDATGCTETKTISVNEDSALSLSVSTTHIDCNGNMNGAIDLSISGGVTPYTISWSNGASTEDLSTLAAGTYNVSVTDNVGCNSVLSVTITEPDVLSLSTSQVDIQCNGEASGSINLTVSGGTGPYTYSWDNGAVTEDLTGIMADTYNVIVTDANGCVENTSVTITEPALLTLSTSQVNVDCEGGNDGSIDLTVTGGTAPYNYTWDNGAVTEDLSDLLAGTYNITVTDANGCAKSTSVTITEPSLLTLSVSQVNVDCNGNDSGSIDLTVTGGTTPYTYSWNNGESSQDLSNLTAGVYQVIVTDANGCSETATVTISEPAPLVLTTSQSDILCSGDAGAIDLTVTGGTAPYTYSWSNGATSEDLSGLAAASYMVTVTDANGCSENTTVIINEVAALVLSFTKTDLACKGDNDGSIDLTVTGGTAPYTYAWSNSESTEDLSGLVGGSYSVVVTDSNGCAANLSVSINEPASDITATATVTDISCNGLNDGTIDVVVTGGTAPYSYQWSNGANTQDLAGIPAGTYNVTITDANGCFTIPGIVVSEPDPLLLSTTHMDVDCNAGTNGSIDLIVTGGTAPYSYAWDHGSNTEDLSSLAAGTYTVVVTDANGCSNSTSVTITQPAVLSLGISKTDVSCTDGNDGAIDVSVSGGTSPYTFSWSNGAGSEDMSMLSAGVYNLIVTDANGCSESSSITITEPGSDIVGTYTVTDVSCNGGNDGSIELTVSGGTAPYSFLWNNGSTNEDPTGLTAGTYNVTITDANGCKSISGIVISEPTEAILINAAITNLSCQGASDGSINITVTGGNAPYAYSWNTGASSEDLSSVPAGSYSLVVTDANGCTESINLAVSEPVALSLSTSHTNVSCFGSSDGTIDLSVTGGTGLYSYTWDHGASSEDLTGLAAGNYMILVTDANGCTASTSISITQPNEIVLTANITDAGCGGGLLGSIDLTVAGGSAPYGYSWSNGAITEDISALGYGVYTVEVTDANGCTTTRSFSVNEDASLSITANESHVSCPGGSDGAVDITVAGGNAPYSYQWSTGAVTEDLTNLSAGSYQLTVTDSDGCQSILQVDISEPDEIGISSAQTDVTCNGDSDGTIALTLTGGTSPYSITITPNVVTGFQVEVTDANACPQATFSLTHTDPTFVNTLTWTVTGETLNISGLAAGDYDLVRPDQGNALIETISISEPDPISINGSIQDALCLGDPSGAIDLTVSGGTGPYSYAWSNGAVTKNINGLAASTYMVTVTDSQGCMEIASFAIGEPDPLSLRATIGEVSCAGAADGSISLSVIGGTAPYSYSWSNGQTSPNISSVITGTYQVTVTDANGCTITDIFEVSQPAALDLSLTASDISCFGANDGSISTTISGGTAPYSYSWSHGAVTADVNNLAPANYTLVVTDANGCSISSSVLVNEPTQLTLGASLTNISCSELTDGAIDIVVSGGTAPYAFTWSNGSTTEDINAVAAGSYTVTATDANGCQITGTFELSKPAPLSASFTQRNVICYNGNQGSIDISVTGGVAPYQYLWSDEVSTEDRHNVPAGFYNVVITDANGCTTSLNTEITQPDPITLSPQVQDISCFDQQDGQIDIIVSGGVAPYTYLWSNGKTTQNAANLGEGSYTVLVTDANGCTSGVTLRVEKPEALSLNVESTPAVDCENRISYATAAAQVSGGTAPFTYIWDNEPASNSEQELIYNPGTHRVRVIDAHGCETSTSFEVALPVLAENTLDYNALIDPTGAVTLNTAVVFSSTNTGNAVSWSWDFGDGNAAEGREVRHTYTETGSFDVVLTVTDDNGCVQVLEETLYVDIGYRIIMPTAFTPNEDGRNDRFYPEFYGLKYLRLIVFNNWGEVVFHMEDVEGGGWDGIVKGKEAPGGGYAYKLEAESISGERIEKTGSFLLVR